MITTSSGKDSQAWRNAARRMSREEIAVSDTWNVIPMVNAR